MLFAARDVSGAVPLLAINCCMLLIALIAYLVLAFSLVKILDRLGEESIWKTLAWIPVVNALSLVKASGLPLWTVIFLLIPLVNFIYIIVLQWKVGERLRVSTATLIISIILNIFLPPFGWLLLAYSS